MEEAVAGGVRVVAVAGTLVVLEGSGLDRATGSGNGTGRTHLVLGEEGVAHARYQHHGHQERDRGPGRHGDGCAGGRR